MKKALPIIKDAIGLIGSIVGIAWWLGATPDMVGERVYAVVNVILPFFMVACGIFMGWSAKSWYEEYRKNHAHDWFVVKEQAMVREFRSMRPDWKNYVLIALRCGSTVRQGSSSVDLEGCQFFEKVTVSDFTTKYVLTDEAKDFFGRNQDLIEEYKCDSAAY